MTSRALCKPPSRWATPRLMTFLLVCFAVLALTLAVIGLYGVMAFNGLRRMREIGVRLALGAMPAQIRTMMLKQGMRLLVAGLVLGFVGLSVPGFTAHFTPCVEIGWRLGFPDWGRGFATEAARDAVRFASAGWKHGRWLDVVLVDQARERGHQAAAPALRHPLAPLAPRPEPHAPPRCRPPRPGARRRTRTAPPPGRGAAERGRSGCQRGLCAARAG